MKKFISLWMGVWVVSSILISQASWARAKAPVTPPPVTAPLMVEATPAEDWKGPADSSVVQLGALAGLGVLDAQSGFALLGTAAGKILKNGFIPNINNSAWIEAEVGPLFTQGEVALQYSLHLRWDFQKDAHWTFYALGGVGGDFTGQDLGSRFIMLPRFAAGAFYKFNELFLVRGEISHELTAVGVTFPFWL